MPRPINRLSARTVATLKEPGRHGDGAGLYLHIDANLSKRWVLVFQWQGVRKEMGLGSASTVSLAAAREARDAARQLVAEGVNPIEARRAGGPRAVTFGDVADEVLAEVRAASKHEKHTAGWDRSLKVLAAELRPIPVAEVEVEHVLKVLQPIWRTTPETADRTRGRIERVLDAAAAKKLRSSENPARWRGNLKHLLTRRKKLSRGHHPALPYADMPAFMADLRTRPAMAARALEFTILTAARTGEVLGALWSEIDLGAELWTVPPERMKGGVEHRVPLSAAAVQLLKDLGPEAERGAYVFPRELEDAPLSNMAMAMLLRRMNRSDITVHGFRSTFRDWAEECTSFPGSIAEAALAHQTGDEVERAYRRGDALAKRRKLMEAWAGYCARPASGKVVALRRG